MNISFNGRVFLTDDEGFLQNSADWSEELMFEMAKLDNLTLTEDHLVVIKAVQDYFKEYDTTPAIRILLKYLKETGHENLASSVALARLFPNGAAKSAAKYAGLKKPIKCI